MNSPRIGSLFSGAGGLDIAVEHITGGQTIWQAEIDRAASMVLAYHWPDVPNLGDVSKIHFSQRRAEVAPIDILTLGFPCQDVSVAGLRKGMAHGTRSGLWAQAVRCIGLMRPPTVVVENVPGLLSIDAGGGRKGIDVVIADLEALGYGVAWTVVSAASVGAPHLRKRVFILAQHGVASRGRIIAPTAHNSLALLPTPQARDAKGRTARARSGGEGLLNEVSKLEVAKLLPTPQARDRTGGKADAVDRGRGYSPNLNDLVAAKLLPTPRTSDCHGQGAHGTGGQDLRTTVTKLLPTPIATDGTKNIDSEIERVRHSPALAAVSHHFPEANWGEYTAAIVNWEQISESATPPPVEPSMTGGLRLAAEFSEWMMGWPAGWVTDLLNKNPRLRLPGRFAYKHAMRIIGNGVVAHQAAAALELLGIYDTVDFPTLVG